MHMGDAHEALARENARLSAICRASERLHRTGSWSGALEALVDVALAELKAEVILIYEVIAGSAHLVGSFGAETDLSARLGGAAAAVHSVIASGTTLVDARPSDRSSDGAPLAVVPLVFSGAVVGAMAIARACGSLDPIALDVLETMSVQGGIVFYCAALASRRPTLTSPASSRMKL
jgi:hypothetical protein